MTYDPNRGIEYYVYGRKGRYVAGPFRFYADASEDCLIDRTMNGPARYKILRTADHGAKPYTVIGEVWFKRAPWTKLGFIGHETGEDFCLMRPEAVEDGTDAKRRRRELRLQRRQSQRALLSV